MQSKQLSMRASAWERRGSGDWAEERERRGVGGGSGASISAHVVTNKHAVIPNLAKVNRLVTQVFFLI